MIVYEENPQKKKSTKQRLLELKAILARSQGTRLICKINHLSYTTNEQLELKIKNRIPFTLPPKEKKST